MLSESVARIPVRHNRTDFKTQGSEHRPGTDNQRWKVSHVTEHNLAENESKSGAYYRLLYIIDWLTSCRCVVEDKKQESVCDKGSVSLRISYRCANTSLGTVSQYCWRQHWG